MKYSECVSDDEYYVCPSEFGDDSKTSCCEDSYGGGQCCVPETVGTQGQLWASQEDSSLIYYMDYLLIFGASVVLLVIMGLLCCEYAEITADEGNSHQIQQRAFAPQIALSQPHEYNGNNFRVIREYNRHIDTAPSAPPCYYEEFDNGSSVNYGRPNSTDSAHNGSKLDPSFNQHSSFAEPHVKYQFESASYNNYRPPSNAPRRSPPFFNWS